MIGDQELSSQDAQCPQLNVGFKRVLAQTDGICKVQSDHSIWCNISH